MTNVRVWAWDQKPWCTDVQRHMHCREDAEVKSRHLRPTIPSLTGRQGTNDLCKKRTYVYKSTFFHYKKKRNKKKKKPGENLIFVSWLGSDFWLRQHDPFFIYQVLVSGWYWTTYSLTHSINQSINLLTHSINQAHSLIHPLNHSLSLLTE